MRNLPWPTEPPRHGAVVLRAFARGDVDMVVDMSSSSYDPTAGTLPHHADEAEARAWIRRQSPRLVDMIGYSFCIADAATDEALGHISLYPKDLDEGRAAIGYCVAPRARGRGVATDAVGALTTFGWTLPRLHRLEAYIEPWNTASVRCVMRMGFQFEGLLRGRSVIGGERRDVLLYARLRSDGPLPGGAAERTARPGAVATSATASAAAPAAAPETALETTLVTTR